MATTVRPPRPGRTRAALADVTNTKDDHLVTDLKESRGKVATKQVAGTPSSLERSKTPAAGAVAEVVKSVRGRKAKEQVQLESKFGDVESKSVAKKKGVTPKPRVQVESKLTKKIVKEIQTSAEELEGDQHESNAVEQKQESGGSKASKRSVAQKQGAENLAEAESKLKLTTVTKRRTEPAKAKKSSATEVTKCEEASPSSVQAVGIENLDSSVSEPSGSKASKRSVAQKQGANPRENLAEAEPKLKLTTVTRGRTEPAKAKKSRATEGLQEVTKCGEASPSSVQAVGIENLDASVSDRSGSKATKRSVAQKQGANPRENLAEAESKLKLTTVTKRRTEPKKSRATEGPQEVTKRGEASPSSVQAVGIENLNASASDQVRESESVQKTKTVVKRGPMTISSLKGRPANGVKQGRKVPLKPLQDHMESQIADDKGAKNVALQTPGAGRDTRTTDVVVAKAKGKKGTGKGIARADELGASTLKSVTSASNHDSCAEGPLRSTHSVTKVARGNLAELTQSLRRNASRGARKAVNYSEDIDEGKTCNFRNNSQLPPLVVGSDAQALTRIVRQTVRKGRMKDAEDVKIPGSYENDDAINSGKEILQDSVNHAGDDCGSTAEVRNSQRKPRVIEQVLKQSVGDVQAVKRTVRQTVRKGRMNDAEDVKIPGSYENDDSINSGKENLQDSVNHAGDDCGSTAEVLNSQRMPQVIEHVSKHSVADVQTVKRTVRQTVRKGRAKDTKADDIAKSINKDDAFLSAKKDLPDGVHAIPSTFENSLEEEYERFKREIRAQKEGAKLPQLTTPAKLATPSERSLVDFAKPLIPNAECTSLVETVVSSNVAIVTDGGLESRSDGTHHAKLMVKSSSISATRKDAHESGLSVGLPSSKNSSNCNVEPVSCSEIADTIKSNNLLYRTPLQRGQKRSWKENVDEESIASPVQSSQAECNSTDSKVGAETAPTSSLKLDIDECDDRDDGHVIDEDSQRSVVGHEDLVCVDVSGRESDDPLLKAIANFDEADIPTKVKDCCKNLGKPSTIQSHSLPYLLAGCNLVAISDSPTEQILAYGVAVLVHAMKKKKSYVRKRPSPIGLVLVSSDELVQQVTDVFEGSFSPLRVKIGSSTSDTTSKMNTVKPGVAVLVTTPSCLQKMVEDGRWSLDLVSFIVLAGADCMLQNGMEASLRAILDQAPTCRQIGVFSSTWEPEIEQLVKDLVSEIDLVKISVKNPVVVPEQIDEEKDVTQIVEVLEDSDRDTRLTALLRMFQKGKKNRVLVYVLYKEEALHVEGLLQQRGWKVAAVHGGIFEADRNKAVVSFQKSSSSILVATDVAARGLVIPNVDYVINYSFPYTFEDYACRLRQTGRIGRKGIMHTFFMPANQARAKELVEVLREAEQDVPENLLKLTSPAQKKPRIEY